MHSYRNWPRYGLRWSGLCWHSRHSTSGAGRRAAAPAGSTCLLCILRCMLITGKPFQFCTWNIARNFWSGWGGAACRTVVIIENVLTFATAVPILFTSVVYRTNVYWSVIHGIKRKPHLSVVWNWYHFVAIAILHQPRPTDSADINTRLRLQLPLPPMILINNFSHVSNEWWGHAPRVWNASTDGGSSWYTNHINPYLAESMLGHVKLEWHLTYILRWRR